MICLACGVLTRYCYLIMVLLGSGASDVVQSMDAQLLLSHVLLLILCGDMHWLWLLSLRLLQ